MSLEIGSRFRLPDGRLVEVVPDVEKILNVAFTSCNPCVRCYALKADMDVDDCEKFFGCDQYNSRIQGLPRILKEVENE